MSGHNRATCGKRTKPALVLNAVHSLETAIQDTAREIQELQATLVPTPPPAPPSAAILPTGPQWDRLECISVAIKEVATVLPKGLFEMLYAQALHHELEVGHQIPNIVEQEAPILYKGIEIGVTRTDILIPDGVTAVVELKAVQATLSREHLVQLLSYMKTSDINVGVLVNFKKTLAGKLEMFRVFKSGDEFYELNETTLQGVRIKLLPLVEQASTTPVEPSSEAQYATEGR